MVLHLADQSLNGFSAPDLHATAPRTQMAAAIDSGITSLELGEKFYGGLIWILFQLLSHLSPVSCAALCETSTSARLVAEAAVFESSDQDAPSARILAPRFYALRKRIYVLRMKSSWKLEAELLEQLRGRDIREPFEAATHQWPDHCERVVYGLAGFGIDQLWPFGILFAGTVERVAQEKQAAAQHWPAPRRFLSGVRATSG